MVRVTFALLCLIGILFLVTTGIVRAELSLPGILPFWDSVPEMKVSTAYQIVAHLHGDFGATMVFLIAAFMSFVSAARGSPMGRVWGWAALILAGLQVGLELWEVLDDRIAALPAFPDVISHTAENRSTPLAALTLSDEYFQMSSLALTLLAAGTAVCQVRTYRLGSLLLTSLTVLTYLLYTYLFIAARVPIGLSLFLVPEIVLLALLAITLVDPARSDEPHLTVGIGIVLVATLAFDVIATIAHTDEIADTYFALANAHLARHGLSIFVFFCAWFQWRGRGLSEIVLWLHSGVVALGLILTAIPMIKIGIEGGKRLEIESPLAYPQMQLVLTIGAISLTAAFIYGLAAPFLHRLLR